MATLKLTPYKNVLQGELEVPGDKSISHRAIIFGSLANGTTKISNFLNGEDCLRSIDAFRAMGVSIEQDATNVTICSAGKDKLTEPVEPIYFGNSGTTARLMLGVLAGLPFFTTAYGDPSLTVRPMDRVIKPIQQMGALTDGRSDGGFLPMAVRGGNLKSISYTLPVKSAQVKSAVLLAGLFAKGVTKVTEQTVTRNHTENMMAAFGAGVKVEGNTVYISNKPLYATDVFVPGDISSAAFPLAGAAIVPGSNITIKNVGLNNTRTGIIDALLNMGADITISNEKTVSGEPIGDLTITYKKLKGTVIEGDIIPKLIDELPIIALVATQAEGKTVIRDAGELRLKETDRIEAVAEGLRKLGANLETTKDGMIIHGTSQLTGGHVSSFDDHRIAMMLTIASLIADEEVIIDDISSVSISYPDFFKHLDTLKSTP
ncbi:3-phosphoshikimate 1-carboxyvinyltransferase [Virgibacillus siamensis]|uniref:3-phosphoshikimate 1-carboxyvinyltransferase n=1 Tax=Virgibacillus siamensis TaxID=480071 RepID=UPI001FE71A7E|nr:3-phosphoshikimate 1-carboxyvinyltransferase [Virgibacillus siamensis]